MEYLSLEWISAADAAVKAAAGSAPAESLIIDQHVEGAVNYRIVLGSNPSVQVISSTDADSPADAVFSQDLATATAVATGATDAHQAFLLGDIRFAGNVNLLIERRDAFDWLQAALGPVIGETDFA